MNSLFHYNYNMKRGASLKRKQVGKQEEIHFNDDDELDSNDEEEEGVPTSAIKEVKDDEEAPGIYVVRFETNLYLILIKSKMANSYCESRFAICPKQVFLS